MNTDQSARGQAPTSLNYQERLAFEEREFRHLRQGSYSDILFVLLPFLAIMMQRLWSGEPGRLFMGPELAIAATVFGGLSISKFAQTLTRAPDLSAHKERITFSIAGVLFLVLVPASILTLKLSAGGDIPWAVSIINPVLLVAGIALYVVVIRTTRLIEEPPAPKETVLPPPSLAPFEIDAFGATEMNHDDNKAA